MPPEFQSLPGTHDVFPPESGRWAQLIAAYARLAERSGFGLIVNPMIEDLGVFQRVGESTDIVRKEMYSFEDKGGRLITLRPEGTASVARAFIQHRPATLPWKVWYTTPKFRYERPQAGRYRQHHEVGCEALGSDDPDLDVEVIALAWGLYQSLGLRRIILRLTSLGDATCRPAYRVLLVDYLTSRRADLCDEHRDRIEANPLRVLDCKRPACVEVGRHAPRLLDHLCDECQVHFARVTEGLTALSIPFSIDTSLVRGLDYYTRTTFEFMADALESAQNGAGGGGRYDRLVEELGGPQTPGIGFGLGIERILLACDAEGVFPTPTEYPRLDVFIVDTTDGSVARDLSAKLRTAGIATDRGYDHRSYKAQMKSAMRSGARFAVVAEPDGLTLRTLQEKGEPEQLDADTAIEHIKKRLAS